MRSVSFFIRYLFWLCLIYLPMDSHADWLNFRGPGANGVVSDCADLPTDLAAEGAIAWQIDLPGRGLGSPLVVGDRIYLTAASGPEQRQLHILCFSAADGAPIWERRFWATGRTMCHKKTCVAAPSPASDGQSIYAFYSSNDLIAVSLDGDVRWMRGLTLDYPNASNSLGMSSSLVVADDTVVVQVENDSESFAAGIDTATGLNRWKIDRPKKANWTSPVVMQVDQQAVVALQSSAGVLGVLPKTGSALFDFDGGASTIPSSVAVGDTLYVPSHGLTALRASADGSGIEKLWNEGAQRPGTASPIVVDGKVYTINGAGVLSCGDPQTGERLWRIRLKGPFGCSPVSNGSHLYIFNEMGVGQCIDITGEAEARVVSEVELDDTILSTPALSDDSLYIRSDKHLWKFSKPTE